jgi:hypothetical protein
MSCRSTCSAGRRPDPRNPTGTASSRNADPAGATATNATSSTGVIADSLESGWRSSRLTKGDGEGCGIAGVDRRPVKGGAELLGVFLLAGQVDGGDAPPVHGPVRRSGQCGGCSTACREVRRTTGCCGISATYGRSAGAGMHGSVPRAAAWFDQARWTRGPGRAPRWPRRCWPAGTATATGPLAPCGCAATPPGTSQRRHPARGRVRPAAARRQAPAHSAAPSTRTHPTRTAAIGGAPDRKSGARPVKAVVDGQGR